MPSRGYHGYVDKSEAQLNSHASNNAIPEEFKVQTVEENGDESMGKKHQEGIKGGRRRTGFWATLAKYGWH